MTVYVCVDDGMGVGFNGRRQSRDSVVTEKIWEMSGGSLLMSRYSAGLFARYGAKGADNCAEKAEKGDHYFSEAENLGEYEDKIQRLVIFRWNRDYPRDVLLGIDTDKFTKEDSIDICGTSHEKITCEVWVR